MQGDKQGKEAAFGGMAVVLSGDFQQLPVVAGLSIIDGLLERCNRNPKPPRSLNTCTPAPTRSAKPTSN